MQEENNCIGLFGWLFGHKFISFIIHREIPKEVFRLEITSDNLGYAYDILTTKTFIIRCKRCGIKGQE